MAAIKCAYSRILSSSPALCSIQYLGLQFQKSCSLVKWSSSSTDAADRTEEIANNDTVNTNFVNRNPRNLEQMEIAQKKVGWRFQYPTREYYHRLVFNKTQKHTSAQVEHTSGAVVVSASTRELAIAKFLYSNTDVSAAKNVGRVMAQRCWESGIECLHLFEPPHSNTSPSFLAFKAAIEDGGVELSEPDVVTPEYKPGIDYDDVKKLEEIRERQRQVMKREATPRAFFRLRSKRRRPKIPNGPPHITQPTNRV